MDPTRSGGNRPRILAVDDSPENLAVIEDVLKHEFDVISAGNGERALELAAGDERPDLILLDVLMPGLDGYQVCRRLKQQTETRSIPVIFLTGQIAMADERAGLEAGAVDYITKPFSAPIVIARVRTHLELKRARDFLQDKNEYLEAEVERRTDEVRTIQNVTLVAMGSLAETRDNETGNHIRRTQDYMRVLALELARNPHYAHQLRAETVEQMCKSAPLHDIGKVGIPDRILLKRGKLTRREFEIMKTHTTIGKDSIAAAERVLGSTASFLQHARQIAWTHHEKWDGSGYPRGLRGDDIPIAGRVMAVVDVYDALRSRRVYKPAFSHDDAIAIIRDGSGTHFDPQIAETFLSMSDRFREIALRFTDPEQG